MSPRFDSLLLRGVFGAVLGLAVLAGAASQAFGFRGELVLHEGRLTIVPAAEPVVLCAIDADASNATRTQAGRG